MGRNKFRRRNASENLSVNDSGRRRPWAELNVSSVAELRKDFGNRSRNLVLAELQVKHAAKEKEYRALMVSRRSNNNSGSSSNAPAHPVQPSGDKGRGSRKAGKRGHQEKRRHQGRDKYIGIIVASLCRSAREAIPTATKRRDYNRSRHGAVATAIQQSAQHSTLRL